MMTTPSADRESSELASQANLVEYFLHRRIAEGVGDRVAVRTQQRSFTYREVQERTQRFAALLLARGLRCEERVLLAVPDGIDMVAALLGVVHAGGVAVMINPDVDRAAFQYFFDYTRARFVVCTGTSRAALDACTSPFCLGTLDLDDPAVRRELEQVSPQEECFASHEDDAAIWLFSGGTTGKPKAVVQTHRSFVNTTERYGHGVLGLTPEDITLSVPKLHFGYATGSNLLFPFSVGASTLLFPERCTAERLFGLIESERPTILINVPTMIGKLLAAPDAEQRDLSSLRLCTSAGEALPEDLHRRWTATYGCEILDGLGTAEMWHVFLTNHPGEVRHGTLGRAVQGFDVQVRDDEGNQLSPGEIGWLWVRGDSRGQGYWQRRERTRQTFRGEWVVTGDMVRRDADGYFTYCGRGDDMLKVSGKWMSPKEVENCLLQHPAVQEAAVLTVPDREGLPKPWAFVLAQPDAELASPDELADALRSHALHCLEPYKAPRVVKVLAEFPRTHLGKIDRGALRRTYASAAAGARSVEEP